ncbi:MAG: TIGR02757 family protein [Desulfobacteraceae bacterium]|nr:TIGR02757 family protein [Desulfobacteraceae bacterium]
MDPDPLLFLYDYPKVRDREIAGLVAACLAYGRVEMIMKIVGQVLEKLGQSPFNYLVNTRDEIIDEMFMGFKYRFATDIHLSSLLKGIKHVIMEYGSLENCFSTGVASEDGNVLVGLGRLYRQINQAGHTGHLLADPQKNSACKRSHLFLRWMVRKDAVDPGGWESVSPRQLIIPLDTHMYKIGTLLGFTRRKSPDKICALEITEGFRDIWEQDPVKYDFSLTRFGIRRNLDLDELNGFINLNHLAI